jgi:cyclomaltodextrinase
LVSWIGNTIWWHVYPLGFFNAPKVLSADFQPVSHLRAFEPWIHYLKDLGGNGLLLAPVFTAESHGYDTIDYFNVDPRLGTNADLIWLIERCHEQGVRVVLDGVFNHVGRGFPQFRDVQEHKGHSRYVNWFHIDWNNKHNEDGFGYADFEGHRRLVKLNHSNPEVEKYVIDVMCHWLNAGIDGWRLDAAYAVSTSFWHSVADRVRERFNDAWLMGEVIHGDYNQFIKQGHLESVTQYELWKAIWSAINDQNFFELAHALKRHATFSHDFLPATFLGNHDVTRIASVLKDERHLAHAVAILCTVPGTPCVYYGDEQGYKAVKEKRSGGDDAIRPAFPPTPEQFAHPNWNLHHMYKELLQMRRDREWISRSGLNVKTLTNKFLTYETEHGASCLLTALNVSDEAQNVNVSDRTQVLTAGTAERIENNWSVPAHSFAIFSGA